MAIKLNLRVGPLVALAAAWPAQVRNDKYILPTKAALDSTEAREKPDRSVKFFVGKQSAPKGVTSVGSVTFHGKASTRQTGDVKACNAAFVAALVNFKKNATRGADGVANIVSYKNVEMAGATEFECHAGAAAHAILRGDLVRLRINTQAAGYGRPAGLDITSRRSPSRAALPAILPDQPQVQSMVVDQPAGFFLRVR